MPLSSSGLSGAIRMSSNQTLLSFQVNLYTKQGTLKYQTDCAPINGYYMVPVYDKGEYVLKVNPPPGWTFGMHYRHGQIIFSL